MHICHTWICNDITYQHESIGCGMAYLLTACKKVRSYGTTACYAVILTFFCRHQKGFLDITSFWRRGETPDLLSQIWETLDLQKFKSKKKKHASSIQHVDLCTFFQPFGSLLGTTFGVENAWVALRSSPVRCCWFFHQRLHGLPWTILKSSWILWNVQNDDIIVY